MATFWLFVAMIPLLSGDGFCSRKEIEAAIDDIAKVEAGLEALRDHDNNRRPNSSLGYKAPAESQAFWKSSDKKQTRSKLVSIL